MILREIKNIYIKNRLTEGVDFVRKEWLCGDGRAYIDTKITDLSVSDYIKTIFDDSYNVGFRTRAWGREGNRLIVGNENLSTSLTVWGTSSSFRYTNGGIYVYDMYFDLLNNKVIINNQTYSIALPHGNGVSFFIFARHKTDGIDYINWAKFKSFEIHNQVNLVPCQLLKSIPATLDANNKSRAAGECGMYDSISGKFYGNVSNSGTFTVEGEVEPETHSGLQQIYQNRLIEGVDYDVYTYLKGTGCCYIDTLINPAWNDTLSATTEVSRRPTVHNPSILAANGTNTIISIILSADWYKNNNPQFLVVNKVVGTDEYFVCKNVPANAELYASFKVVNNSRPTVTFKVNGTEWTEVYIKGSNIITELPDTTYKIGRDTANGLDVLKLKNIKINRHNFIPCKLKRTIPRNLDAQCKERQAGECGMIDLISGKFYGNVASSGTFTVENDNNE